MNKYSFTLLQNLKWSQEILLFFETEKEAKKVLGRLFPNPDVIEAENMEIRVKIVPFDEIDWKFQSTWKGFRNVPAKPLKVFHKL